MSQELLEALSAPETTGEKPKRVPADPFVSLQLPPVIIVVEGEPVTLECEFTLPDSALPAATPDDNVHWSFESSNEKLVETLRSENSSSKANRALVIKGKLVIEHVQPTRQGIYSCQLRTNYFGRADSDSDEHSVAGAVRRDGHTGFFEHSRRQYKEITHYRKQRTFKCRKEKIREFSSQISTQRRPIE